MNFGFWVWLKAMYKKKQKFSKEIEEEAENRRVDEIFNVFHFTKQVKIYLDFLTEQYYGLHRKAGFVNKQMSR